MRHLTRFALISSSIFSLSLLGLGGCKGCGGKGSKDPGLTITNPTDGAAITLADDIDPGRVGIQIPVAALVENVQDGSGAAVIINDDSNLAVPGFVVGNNIAFPAVTVVGGSDGQAVITVTVRDRDTDKAASDTVTLSVESANTLDCQFSAPEAQATLGEADDVDPNSRGFQYDVVVQCSQDLTGTPANLSIDGRGVASVVFAGVTATFPSVTFNEGSNLLQGSVNTVAGSWTDQVRTIVDTPSCEVRLSPDGAVAFNLDGDPPRISGTRAVSDADADPSNGIQAILSATTPDCQGGQAVLQIEGSDRITIDVLGTSVDFGSVDLPDGEAVRVQVEVRPQGAGGPSGISAPQDFLVDALRPAPNFIFPTAGVVFGGAADKDNDPSNGIQVDVVVEVPGLEITADPAQPERSAAIEVLLTNLDTGVTTTVACVAGVDGCEDPTDASRYLLEITLDADGGWSVESAVTDPAGNVGAAAPVTFVVSTGGGNVSVTAPLEGAVVNRATPATTDSSVPVTVSAPTLPVGSPVTVLCTGAAGSGTGTLAADGTALVDLAFTALPCEGAVAVCTASVEVGGTAITGPPVSFTVDLSPPSIGIAVPADGDTVYDTAVAVEVVTTCLEDGQSVDVNTDTGASASATVAADGAIVGLTLLSGNHVLTASAMDVAGNAVSSAPVAITVDANPPQVVFVQPSDGLVLAAIDDADAAAPGFQYDVTVQVANKPAGVSVVLQIGLDDGGSTVWRAPIGPALTDATLRATLVAIDLPEGAFSLRAIATSSTGLAGEKIIAATVNTGLSSCNIVAPVDGRSLGLGDDQNASAADGVQTDVRVRTDAADGATVDLVVTDPSGATVSSSATANGGEAIFTAVSFLADAGGNRGTNLLDATCDVGGTAPGVALRSVIEVDLEAPVAVIAAPLDGRVFNLSDVDASAAPGFQVDFVATASDLSTGTSVKTGSVGSLEVRCTTGTPYTLPLTFGIFATATEARARPTLEDQADCTLTFTATDQAGNVGAPVSVTVTVDRQAPAVDLPGLTTGQIFNAGDDSSGVAGFQRDVRVSFTGVEPAGAVALLVTNTYGDTGAAGWSRQDAEGSPVAPAAGATDHLFSGSTLTLGTADTVTLTAVATDAAGNSSEVAVTLTVDLVAPVVSITRPDPANLPSCFNVFSDTDGPTPGLQIQVNVSTVGVEDGLPLSLCSSVDPGTGLGACAGNPANFVVDQSNVAGNLAIFLPATFADGTQDLQAEVRDRAGNFSSSPPFSLCVDTTPPDVTAFTVDSDTLAPSGTVNSVEWAAAGNQVCFTINAVDADGQVARIETNNPVAGAVVGTGTVTAGSVTICGALAEGGHALSAIVFDAAGNPNLSSSPPIVDPEAQLTLIVDTQAPTISIASPAGSVLNAAGDAIPLTTDYDFDFAATSDAGTGQAITFLIDTSSVGAASLAGGTATLAAQALAQGAHVLRVEVQDAAGNPAFAERTVTVDTLAPTVTILSPSAGILNVSDVAFLVQVTGASPGDPLDFIDQLTAGNLAARSVVLAQPQTETITLVDANFEVVAQVTDGAGNIGTSAPLAITVDTLGCSIRWVTPASAAITFVAADDAQAATAGLQTTITATTTDCAGRDIELWVSGALVSTLASNGTTGDASFLLDLADGVSGVPVMARILDIASNVTTTTFTAAVDISPPGLTRDAPLGAAFTYVASTNAHLASGTFAGTTVIADKIAGGSLEADFTFTVSGGVGGTLQLLFGGSDLMTPVAITSDPQTVLLTDVVIAQDSVGNVTARATDAAGNVTDDLFAVTVDVQAPAVPTVTSSLLNNRTATVDIAWSDTGDDASAGTAATYDLRWSTADIANETDFDAATLFPVGFAPAVPGSAQTLSVTPLPPINTYWLALRVEDEVGNRSPLTNVVSQANLWTTTSLAGQGGNFPWQMVPGGDLNNDGFPDFVATAITFSGAAGAVYVYFGGAPYAQLTARRQQIVTGNPSDYFGVHVQAADVSGDGIDDLVVGAFGFGSFRGRVRIYFGQDHSLTDCSVDFSLCWLDPADFVELRGAAGSGQFGKMVGTPGDFMQVGNPLPDGSSEVLVGAPADGSARGRIYVYGSRSKAAWQAAQTATDAGDLTPYIPTALADFVVEGSAVNDALGYRWGVVGLGDLDGDGSAEVGFSSSAIATEYVHDGATLAVSTGTLSPSLNAISILSGLDAAGDYDLGTRAIAAAIRGAATPELILADPAHRQVRVYPTSSTGVGTLLITLRPPLAANLGNFGFDLASGDLNLDGRADLVVGSNTSSAPSGAGVFYNSGSGTFYAGRPDAALIATATGLLGVCVDIGDYDGDGRDELLVGDLSSGSIVVYDD